MIGGVRNLNKFINKGHALFEVFYSFTLGNSSNFGKGPFTMSVCIFAFAFVTKWEPLVALAEEPGIAKLWVEVTSINKYKIKL